MGRVGDHLVDLGAISREQLEIAMASVKPGLRCGSHLVALGLVSQDAVARALAVQKGVHAALAAHFEHIEGSVLELVPADYARRRCVIPIALVGERLAIACLEPRDEEVLQEVADLTGYRLMPAVAPEIIIRGAIARYYADDKPVEKRFKDEDFMMPGIELASAAGTLRHAAPPPSSHAAPTIMSPPPGLAVAAAEPTPLPIAPIQAMVPEDPRPPRRDPLELIFAEGTTPQAPAMVMPRMTGTTLPAPVPRPAPVAMSAVGGTDAKVWIKRGLIAVGVVIGIVICRAIVTKAMVAKQHSISGIYEIEHLKLRATFPAGWSHKIDDATVENKGGSKVRGTSFYRGQNEFDAELGLLVRTAELPMNPMSIDEQEFQLMTGAIEAQLRGKTASNGFTVNQIKCWLSTDREMTVECSGQASRGDASRLFIMYFWPEPKFFVMTVFFHAAAYDSAAAEINGILDSIELTQ